MGQIPKTGSNAGRGIDRQIESPQYKIKEFGRRCSSVIPLIEDSTALKEIVKDIHEMPNDNVPYFTTLVRFQFAMLNKNK